MYDYFKADYNEIRKYAASLNQNSIKDSDIIDVDEIWEEIKVNLSVIREKFIELKKNQIININGLQNE